MKPSEIRIIGTGNVAFHLNQYFNASGFDCDTISSRILEGLDDKADLIIIAVSDDAIAPVTSKIKELLPSYRGIVAHTSGSVEMSVLSSFYNYGVFYPLQTFSREKEVYNFIDIPVFIEGNNADTELMLKEFAEEIFSKVYFLTSEKRRSLHLASVFSCNFVNALYQIGSTLLENENIPFEALRPLIMQTAKKVMDFQPSECQTGPAKRGDDKTINHHLEMLEHNKELKNIYSEITNYIKNHKS